MTLAPLLIAVVGVLMAMDIGPARGDGWTATPDAVAQASEVRPSINYDESRVPAYELPDPLKRADGSMVRTAADWPARRAEILDLFETHMFGRSPSKPEQLTFDLIEQDPQAMDGAATMKRIAIRSVNAGREHAFNVVLFVPNQRTGPVPAFLLLNNRRADNTDPAREVQSDFWPAEEVVARGYAIAALQVRDLAEDNREDPHAWRQGVVSLFESVEERPADGWGALAAWAWGGSRALDYFETDEDVEATRVAVIGHSRGGKAALWAGATDQRFALAISNNSGCGGAAVSRRRFGETVRVINQGFPHWFCLNFRDFNDREDELPFDQHMLIALMAPRAVYVASGDRDLWADPRGEFLGLAHASPVWQLWDEPPIAPDAMPPLDEPITVGSRGYHVRTGGHGLTRYDWRRYLDFADQLWSTAQP